jgi:hypothetical protein
MKRVTMILTIVLLALGLLAATGVAAQTEYDSTINIRNMEDGEATVVIQFFGTDGTHDAAADVTMSIPPQSMAAYFVLQNDKLPEDFQGSAVVASDKELVIVHNLRINVGEQGASTSGFAEGAPVVQLPLLMRNNGGYTTWFSVQNAGMVDAIVEVEFFAGSTSGNDWQWVNPDDQTNQVTIKPGAAYYFDQAMMPELGTRFVGSAIVTSVNGQPLVASAVEVGPNGLFAYDGFGSAPVASGAGASNGGSANILAPLFQYHNAGYQSSIQVQNVGDTPTTVTVSYVPGSAGNACTETHEVAAGASETFGMLAFYAPQAYSNCWEQNSAGGVGTKFVGSAYVSTNSAAQPLLGIVNQMNSINKKSGAYNAFDPGSASQCVAAPLIMDRNSNYWTSLNIMNVGAAATTVTVEYSTYGAITPANDVLVLQPNEMGGILHWNHLGGGERYVGSAVACGTPGSEIVAMVNQLNDKVPGNGDTLYVYNAFNILDVIE